MMRNEDDRNYISVGQWMWLLLLTAIPCIGVVLILIFAFVGGNESRKNYFRAMIAWFLIVVGVVMVLALLGQWPEIQKQMQNWLHRATPAR